MAEAPPCQQPAPAASPGSPRVERPRRKYVLTPAGRRSERARAARRRNLLKARAASKEAIYRPTEKRQAASRANLGKAIAARNSPEGKAAARLNALKHGLFAKKLVAESVVRLGEDPREFREHLRLFAQVYVPEDEEEKELVRRLAETVWRRLRLHHAQARRERALLKEVFSLAPPAEKLTAEETLGRADALTFVLYDFEAFFRESRKVESQIEYLLRRLLRKRSGGTIEYKGFCPRRDPDLEEMEKDEAEARAMKRWLALSPEERTALWQQVSKEVARRNRGDETGDRGQRTRG